MTNHRLVSPVSDQSCFRRLITDHIHGVMERLYQETRALHRQNICNWLQRWHDHVDTTPSIMT